MLIADADGAEQAGIMQRTVGPGTGYGPSLPQSFFLAGIIDKTIVPRTGYIDCDSILAFMDKMPDRKTVRCCPADSGSFTVDLDISDEIDLPEIEDNVLSDHACRDIHFH